MPQRPKRFDCASTFPAMKKIKNRKLRQAVAAVWQRALAESAWKHPADCPFNPALPDISLMNHVNCLAELALAAAEVLEECNPELKLERDHLLAGVFLHDVSKLVEVEPGLGGRPQFSELSGLMPHAAYGAFLALQEGLNVKVANIILSHSRLTGAKPATPEAVLLHYLDYGLADVLRAHRRLDLIMLQGPKFGR